MRTLKKDLIKVWEVWIEPVQHTFSRKVRGNISSFQMALKVKKALLKKQPKRTFHISPEWKTRKQIATQKRAAKRMKGA